MAWRFGNTIFSFIDSTPDRAYSISTIYSTAHNQERPYTEITTLGPWVEIGDDLQCRAVRAQHETTMQSVGRLASLPFTHKARTHRPSREVEVASYALDVRSKDTPHVVSRDAVIGKMQGHIYYPAAAEDCEQRDERMIENLAAILKYTRGW